MEGGRVSTTTQHQVVGNPEPRQGAGKCLAVHNALAIQSFAMKLLSAILGWDWGGGFLQKHDQEARLPASSQQ